MNVTVFVWKNTSSAITTTLSEPSQTRWNVGTKRFETGTTRNKDVPRLFKPWQTLLLSKDLVILRRLVILMYWQVWNGSKSFMKYKLEQNLSFKYSKSLVVREWKFVLFKLICNNLSKKWNWVKKPS
jgi:hypothetical protein